MSIGSWPRAEAVVVGATCPLEIDAEFSAGRAVYALADGQAPGFLLLHRTTSGDGATLGGDLLSPEAWTGLLEAEEALALQQRTPVERAVLVWVFRSSKREHWWAHHLEQLQDLGALAHQETPSKPRSTRICLVYPGKVGTARDLWAQESNNEAWRSLLAGARLPALRHARRAFCLALRLHESHVAMLAFAYSQAGKNEDGEGVLAMARRSKGEAFYKAVLERRERLLADLQASQHRPTGAHARGARSRGAFDESRTAGLRAWSSDHETPSA